MIKKIQSASPRLQAQLQRANEDAVGAPVGAQATTGESRHVDARQKFQSLENRLQKSSNHWNFFRRSSRLRAGFALAAIVLFALLALAHLPFPADRLARFPASAVITDRTGEPLQVRLGPDDLDCRPGYVPDETDWIVKAVVAAEDQRFWKHHGVDPLALMRAVSQNITHGRRISGASTISTQVIRLIEPRPRTLISKGMEALRAWQLENTISKNEIIGQWLNRAPFGGNIVGIEAAARRYFGKDAHQLSLAEAALLAGVPQSPSRGRPDRHFERASKRQRYVLERMAACGFISNDEMNDALAQTLAVRPASYPLRAPHFAAWVGAPAPAAPGQPVRTTLDPVLQQLATDVLQRHLATRTADFGAVVILDAKTSAVRAMVGSPDFRAPEYGQVNGAIAPRAAGSTLKPFLYALAMDRGIMTPGTVLADVPTRFRDYEPGNFSPTFRGLVTLHDALVLSLNLPAIEAVRQVGQPLFNRTLRSLGLYTIDQPPDHYGVGIVLGNCEVRLLDLANAYACLARGGAYLPVRYLEDGTIAEARTIFSPEASWLIADILSGEERAMDTTGHAADVRLPPMAWKTGTSAGLRDAWTVAFNPDYVIGVWIGHPGGASSEELVGREMATPVAWELFRQLYPDNLGPWYERPADVVAGDVCAISGRSRGPGCEHGAEDWRIRNVTRHERCPAHTSVAITTPEVKPAPVEVKITSPAPGTTFHFIEELGTRAQQLALQASGQGGPLYWFINDQLVGQSHPGAPFFWPLQRGEHQIVCSTSLGQSDRVRIMVQ